MRTIDYDGRGPREAVASVYTLAVYEQEFGSELLADYMGKSDMTAFGTAIGATTAVMRALWAMLRTANDIASRQGREPDEAVPGFTEWLVGVGPTDVSEVTQFVDEMVLEGFFRKREPAPEQHTQ